MRASDFVRARTVQNNVAVARKFVMAVQHVIRLHVPGSRDDERISAQLHERPQIDNDEIFARFLLPAQFIDGDPGHAQMTQESVPLDVLDRAIGHTEAGDQQ